MAEKKTTILKKGTINNLQRYIGGKIKKRGFEDETLHERLLLLVEEIGELVRSCKKISGMNFDQNREIHDKAGEEVADVINMVFAVGIKLGIDVEKEFLEKEAIVDKRTYARSSKKV